MEAMMSNYYELYEEDIEELEREWFEEDGWMVI